MKMKLFFIVGVIILLLIIILIAYFSSPWIAMYISMYTLPNPPKPETTYGEFPFRLTYELDGEIKIIEDVIICEFDGYNKRTSAGQSRKWKSFLKSGNDSIISLEENKTGIAWITLLDIQQANEKDDFDNEILELYFFGGNGHYYMNDKLGNHDRVVNHWNNM